MIIKLELTGNDARLILRALGRYKKDFENKSSRQAYYLATLIEKKLKDQQQQERGKCQNSED